MSKPSTDWRIGLSVRGGNNFLHNPHFLISLLWLESVLLSFGLLFSFYFLVVGLQQVVYFVSSAAQTAD